MYLNAAHFFSQVILVCLAVITKQEAYLAAGLPYIANYASSYDAHTINHDIRVPIAPAAPLVRTAPFVSAVPEAVAAYSPIASAPFAATVSRTVSAISPFAALTSVLPQTLPAVSPAVAAAIPAVAPITSGLPVVSASRTAPLHPTSRSSIDEASGKINSERPAESPENRPSQVPDAVLLASQFFARNAVLQQQSRLASLRNAPQENKSAPLAKSVPQEEDNQRNDAIPRGFGFVQGTNARFAQIRQNDKAKIDSRIPQQAGQRNVESAKLIRENEDAESVEINSANAQEYRPEGVPTNTGVVPARFAAVAPSVNLLPNVYTSVYTTF